MRDTDNQLRPEAVMPYLNRSDPMIELQTTRMVSFILQTSKQTKG